MKPGRVLVVDDDPTIRETLEFAFLTEGYEVQAAANGQEALLAARTLQPNVIFLDLYMPVMDGWTFATAYREQPGPRAALVVMSATVDARGAAEEFGAMAYVGKPFDLDEMFALAEQAVTSTVEET
jgi:CheY-like chemotaxis protein